MACFAQAEDLHGILAARARVLAQALADNAGIADLIISTIISEILRSAQNDIA